MEETKWTDNANVGAKIKGSVVLSLSENVNDVDMSKAIILSIKGVATATRGGTSKVAEFERISGGRYSALVRTETRNTDGTVTKTPAETREFANEAVFEGFLGDMVADCGLPKGFFPFDGNDGSGATK